MLGIGHRQDKYTKIKILANRAKSYNEKYDELIAQGLEPQEVASILQKEEYEKRHQDHFVEEPYKVPFPPCRPAPASTRSEERCTRATTRPIKI